MRIAMWIIAAFGVLVIVGGIIGYVQAQSLISLVTGIICGVVLLGSALAIMKGINTAHYLAILVTALLTVFFHYRYLTTDKFMPGGLMAIVGVIVTVLLLVLRPRRT